MILTSHLFSLSLFVYCCSLTTTGFASLEAKRNFRAPRVSPKHSSPVANSSISPDEHIIVEDVSCKIDTLSSSLDSKNTNNLVSDASESYNKF